MGGSGGGGGGAAPAQSSNSGGGGGDDGNYWDCSVCTFRNNAEAFKCSMCDVRKGTSTRSVSKTECKIFIIFKFEFLSTENPASTPTWWLPSRRRR